MSPTILTSALCAALLAVPAAAPADEAPGGPQAPEAAPAEVAAAPTPEPSPVASSVARGLPVPDPLLGAATLARAPADEGDAPEVEREIEVQSAEMEQLREAEERAPVLRARPGDGAERGAAQLGLESPLRLRLRDAAGREPAPPPADEGRIALLPELDHDLRRLQAEYDIPIEVNEAVVAYIRFFQADPARRHFLRWLGRAHKYADRFRQILKEHDLPGDTVYLAMIESGFANLAYSRARASGPWQFIAGTGKRMGLRQDFWVDERRDPEKSAHAAARFLKELRDQTGDWRLAWASYNAGPGRILRAQARGQGDFWAMARGRAIRRETKGYVPKLMAAAIIAKHPEAFGFRSEEIEDERWVDYEEVTVADAAPLWALAQAAGVPEETLRELNPELRRSCTPPRKYALKVPKGSAEAFARSWPGLAPSARLVFANHRVVRGESLAAIGAGYGVSASAIERMNGLRSGRRLRPGTELVVPLSAAARRAGRAPASEAMARARIQEYQRANPASVEKEPPPRPPIRTDQVAGRLRATVLVQAGDSLWGIAQRFGVGLEELCRWNGIRNPRRLKLQVGREIVVYPRTTGGAVPVDAARLAGPG